MVDYFSFLFQEEGGGGIADSGGNKRMGERGEVQEMFDWVERMIGPVFISYVTASHEIKSETGVYKNADRLQ